MPLPKGQMFPFPSATLRSWPFYILFWDFSFRKFKPKIAVSFGLVIQPL